MKLTDENKKILELFKHYVVNKLTTELAIEKEFFDDFSNLWYSEDEKIEWQGKLNGIEKSIQLIDEEDINQFLRGC